MYNVQFAEPIVRREPANHVDSCYFSMTPSPYENELVEKEERPLVVSISHSAGYYKQLIGQFLTHLQSMRLYRIMSKKKNS
ncbi:hypothetical protein TNCT_429541 [Trichonephila clavata]|uniref:Uncharacterized protein n=1 Tax=Trichonephila clavata TaxID=2740835 RepID=A0A8X6FLP2_TRICU|nr:hypothetical protein TNCT_429541 [Trichonephila clavata]